MTNELSRRGFLKASGSAIGALALPWPGLRSKGDPLLARVTEFETRLYSRPHPEASTVGRLAFDDVIEVERKVIGTGVWPHNHVWLETGRGFLWSSHAQLVRNRPNEPLSSIPGGEIWTEITVPFVDALRSADDASDVRYRLYYEMVLNVDDAVTGADGQIWYRVRDENGIVMYASGQAFRPITPEELAPISPGIEDKEIRINITRQELSALEQGVEVFFARISSGYAFYPEDGQFTSSTPVGQMQTWRKMVSRHMSGGDAVSGYDLPGVGWTVLFHGSGAALHSAYWHSDYGVARSRGCINLRPEHAKWLFRWTNPAVDYRPGDLTIRWPEPSTKVTVEV